MPETRPKRVAASVPVRAPSTRRPGTRVGSVIRLDAVSVIRGTTTVLDNLTWEVGQEEKWLVLGPNGSGKTTLLNLVAGRDHPTSGTVEVLGRRLGSTDVRNLRRRIGFASPALARQLRPSLPVVDVILSGRDASLETWWRPYDDEERRAAMTVLSAIGLRSRAGDPLVSLSTGELHRLQIARALAHGPELLLLDEPASGLDLGAREELVSRLGDILTGTAGRPGPGTPPGAADGPPRHSAARPPLAAVLVTHHLEEVPRGTTHALLLSGGRAVASGPVDIALSSDSLSRCFGIRLDLSRRAGRWSCTAA